MIKDSKQPPHSCINSPAAHATKQLAFSVSTKLCMKPSDILVSFHFFPLLGTLIFMFLFYLQNRISVLLSQTTSLGALKLFSSGGLTCTAFLFLLPAHLHPLCALFPEEYYITTLVLSRQKQWGHHSYCPRSPIVSYCPSVYPSVNRACPPNCG